MAIPVTAKLRQRIQGYLTSHALSFEEFGKMVGVSGATVCRWLNGDIRKLNIHSEARLREYIDLSDIGSMDEGDESKQKRLGAMERYILQLMGDMSEDGKLAILQAVHDIHHREVSPQTKTSRFKAPNPNHGPSLPEAFPKGAM